MVLDLNDVPLQAQPWKRLITTQNRTVESPMDLQLGGKLSNLGSLRDDSGRLLGEGDYAPTWRADDGVLTWSVRNVSTPTRHSAVFFLHHNFRQFGLYFGRY